MALVAVRTKTEEEEANGIDPNDPIEKLVVKSVRLGEKAARMRWNGLGGPDVEALEDESEQLWKKAKALGRPHVTQENWENLAIAFLKACVDDYEELISGDDPSNNKNFKLIEDILEHQQYVPLDMIAQIDRIKSIYEERFVPYVNAHKDDILNDWKTLKNKKLSNELAAAYMKHRCPLCGGALRPRRHHHTDIIGCSECKLHVVTKFPENYAKKYVSRKEQACQN